MRDKIGTEMCQKFLKEISVILWKILSIYDIR